MYGAYIALNHQVNDARIRDFHVESELERAAELALAGRQQRVIRVAEIRAAAAVALMRIGSWLMPNEPRDASCQPAAGALGLRLGR
jgi:hypothetical protein